MFQLELHFITVRNSSGRGLACVIGGMHGRGCPWQEGIHARGMHGGTCVARRVCMAGEMATAVDGMYPTGMHSCFILYQQVKLQCHWPSWQ